MLRFRKVLWGLSFWKILISRHIDGLHEVNTHLYLVEAENTILLRHIRLRIIQLKQYGALLLLKCHLLLVLNISVKVQRHLPSAVQRARVVLLELIKRYLLKSFGTIEVKPL